MTYDSLPSILLAAALAATAGCHAAEGIGSGTARTEERPVTAFTGVKLSLPARLELTQGDRERVSVTADGKLLPEIESVVEKGILQLRFKSSFNVNFPSKIRIAVSAKTLESLAVSGSGDIVCAAFSAGDLKVSIAGSGDVKLAGLSAAALTVSVAGSGDFTAEGRAQSLTANVAGSGDIHASRLATQSASISVVGSGDAVVWAKDSLKVNVAGSGDVRYYGDPEVKRSILGSGSVKRLGASPG